MPQNYEDLLNRYTNGNYPDKILVSSSIKCMSDVLSQQKDNIALIDYILKNEDALFDNKEAMSNIESFFKTQISVFDAAVKFENDLRNDLDYIGKNEEAHTALNTLRLIITVPTTGKFNYKRLPELNNLMSSVKTVHDEMLVEKRNELNEVVRQCLSVIHQAANGDFKVAAIVEKADNFYTLKKQQISSASCIALLDGLVPPLWQYKDDTLEYIDKMLNYVPEPPANTPAPAQPKPVQKKEIIKTIPRQAMFPAKTLKTESEIDDYIEKVRSQMKQMLGGCDGIKIN